MTLEDNLLHAHSINDRQALADLYAKAAEASKDPDQKFFFLTQAYVFGLECGAENVNQIAQQLRSAGRL